jgi:hypothetical protein
MMPFPGVIAVRGGMLPEKTLQLKALFYLLVYFVKDQWYDDVCAALSSTSWQRS